MGLNTYVLDSLHYLHLIVNFLIEDTVLHESSLLKFFSSIWDAIELGSHLVYSCKSAFADDCDLVILGAATPFSDIPTHI
jgi:hypothetical protein